MTVNPSAGANAPKPDTQIQIDGKVRAKNMVLTARKVLFNKTDCTRKMIFYSLFCYDIVIEQQRFCNVEINQSLTQKNKCQVLTFTKFRANT